MGPKAKKAAGKKKDGRRPGFITEAETHTLLDIIAANMWPDVAQEYAKFQLRHQWYP